MRKTIQTIVIPAGEEGEALLKKLLNAAEPEKAWQEAHAKHGGDDLVEVTDED
jgi:hypothetical protein